MGRGMLLAVDIGNSNIVLGAYEGDRLAGRWRVATDRERTADEYAVLLAALFAQQGWTFSHFSRCIFCSVVPPLTTTFQELVSERIDGPPLVVSPHLQTGMRIRYQNPYQLGADRLVDAVAARHLYGQPVVVVDFGTATTFNVVSPEGDFAGGAIVPGVGISVNALFEHASALPRIELVLPPRAVGTNTVQSMQSGVLYGYIELVEGLVRRLLEELGQPATVVATGGFATRLAAHIPIIDHVNPDLTLEGLRLLYQMNAGPG